LHFTHKSQFLAASLPKCALIRKHQHFASFSDRVDAPVFEPDFEAAYIKGGEGPIEATSDAAGSAVESGP